MTKHNSHRGRQYTASNNILLKSVPGDRSDTCISDTKSLRDEYELLVLSPPSESLPLSSEK